MLPVAIVLAGTGLTAASGGSAQQPSSTTTATPTTAASATPIPTASPSATPSATVTPQPILVVATQCPFPAPATGPIVNVGAAPAVVIGTAGESVSYFDEQQRLIFSNTTFHVENVPRGTVASTITVRTVGGTVGDLTHVAEHQPVFSKGQRSRLFLEPTDGGVYTVVGLAEGKQDAPPGVTAADPACSILPVAVPGTGGAALAGTGNAAAALAVIGGTLALIVVGGLSAGAWRMTRILRSFVPFLLVAASLITVLGASWMPAPPAIAQQPSPTASLSPRPSSSPAPSLTPTTAPPTPIADCFASCPGAVPTAIGHCPLGGCLTPAPSPGAVPDTGGLEPRAAGPPVPTLAALLGGGLALAAGVAFLTVRATRRRR